MKVCNAPGCVNFVFSHSYCARHQYHRTDKKRKEHALKIKTTTVKDIACNFGFDNQTDMFHALWDNARDKNGIVRCQYTREHLNCFYGTELWFNCFAHVLPKGRYTYWKLNPENIRVVFPAFHSCVDFGIQANRNDHPTWNFQRWDKEVETLKQQYLEFKKTNRLA